MKSSYENSNEIYFCSLKGITSFPHLNRIHLMPSTKLAQEQAFTVQLINMSYLVKMDAATRYEAERMGQQLLKFVEEHLPKESRENQCLRESR